MDTTWLKNSWRSWYDWEWRARPGTRLLAWLWTACFALALTVIFTTLGLWGNGAQGDRAAWMHWFGRNFVVSLVTASVIHGMYDIARLTWVTPQRVKAWTLWQRSVFFSSVPMLGVLIGWPLGLQLAGLGWTFSPFGDTARLNLLGSLGLSLVISAALHYLFSLRIKRVEAERRATEAQLRLLQGQIEPHFLFNTLATVQALMDTDTPRAKRMLDSFTDYLRASLGSLRHEQATLGQELDLVDAYLRLMQMRMDDRLHFSIEVPAELRDAALPPLLLQPLVENAIHHGLEPKIEGGSIQLRAHTEGSELLIEVADDGLGLQAARQQRRRGNGVALANLRERLAARHGDAASLALLDNAPGTRAVIRLPLPEPT